MSKSAASESGVLWLLDEPARTAKKIKSAVTDAGREVRFDRDEKAGVSNLLTIHSVLSGRSVADLEVEFEGKGYGDLKGAVAEVVTGTFAPIRERALDLLADPAELDRLLARAADRANEIAEATLARVYDRVGFLPRA
jgi:tryptophanyl-tRNA synthetase